MALIIKFYVNERNAPVKRQRFSDLVKTNSPPMLLWETCLRNTMIKDTENLKGKWLNKTYQHILNQRKVV